MPVSEESLSDLLRFRPWPNGDPGPVIYELAREFLDPAAQRQLLGAFISTEIAMGEARLEGLKRIQAIVGRQGGG